MPNLKSIAILQYMLDDTTLNENESVGDAESPVTLEEKSEKKANVPSKIKPVEDEEPALPLPESMEELLKKGVQFGHAKRYVHPSMFPFIASIRNDVHIIDVEKTAEFLKYAKDFVEQKAADGRLILFVGTKAPLREIVRKAALEAGMPYLVEHWAGGTLTNWKTISLRIERLRELQDLKKSGDFSKYPKQEQSLMQQEMNRLESQWGGIADLKRVPDVVIVSDMQQDRLAVQEANKMKIPVISINDTNGNAALASYPIPANDDSATSVEYILQELKYAILEGKKRMPVKAVAEVPAEKKIAA